MYAWSRSSDAGRLVWKALVMPIAVATSETAATARDFNVMANPLMGPPLAVIGETTLMPERSPLTIRPEKPMGLLGRNRQLRLTDALRDRGSPFRLTATTELEL